MILPESAILSWLPPVPRSLQNSGFQVPGSGFRLQSSRFRVQGSRSKVPDSGFKVQGSGLKVQGSGLKVQGSRFKVQGSRFFSAVTVLAFPILFLLASGCHTAPPPPSPASRPAASLPANALLTQRALLTARGRQFVFNGYLALSESGGKRLVITESFGHVMADVLLKPDGKVFVMQSNRMLTPKRIRRYVAPDLECLFGAAPAPGCAVTMPEPNHFLLHRRGYSLDVRTVETKPGAQPPELFDATRPPKP